MAGACATSFSGLFNFKGNISGNEVEACVVFVSRLLAWGKLNLCAAKFILLSSKWDKIRRKLDIFGRIFNHFDIKCLSKCKLNFKIKTRDFQRLKYYYFFSILNVLSTRHCFPIWEWFFCLCKTKTLQVETKVNKYSFPLNFNHVIDSCFSIFTYFLDATNPNTACETEEGEHADYCLDEALEPSDKDCTDTEGV